VIQETGRIDLYGPLWNTDDIKLHGLRKFDVESRYVPAQQVLADLASQQRRKLMNWNCLNAYLWNGTLALAAFFPEIRLGQRLRIVGTQGSPLETYYVEGVDQNWTVEESRTRVTVTHGWRGTDDEYLKALEAEAARYAPAAPLGDFDANISNLA
jgi:hypothetical protein